MRSSILFEPLPIGRVGVLPEDQRVMIAADFSTFAFMIEEFVALAVMDIVIPASAPEAVLIGGMPPTLRRRIRVVDDLPELEAVQRVLAPVYEEMQVNFDARGNQLVFPKRISPVHRDELVRVHDSLVRMAIGFNHGVQVSVRPDRTLKALRALRTRLRNREGRAVIAEVEGIISGYGPLEVESLVLTSRAPSELISVFDRLVNDESYAQLSAAVAKLAMPKTRRAALARLREHFRTLIVSSKFGSIWNAATKVVNVWKDTSLPEAEQLASIVVPRSFPLLVDTGRAREAAIQAWFGSVEALEPCDRTGAPFADGKVHWLPPLKSLRPSDSGYFGTFSIGNVGEFVDALRQAAAMIERKDTDESDENGTKPADA